MKKLLKCLQNRQFHYGLDRGSVTIQYVRNTVNQNETKMISLEVNKQVRFQNYVS